MDSKDLINWKKLSFFLSKNDNNQFCFEYTELVKASCRNCMMISLEDNYND
jgi:hypothetical protein